MKIRHIIKEHAKNAIFLLDSSDAVMVQYNYDAWGNCKTTVVNSTCSEIAILNPFRYRSYYYDTETKLYFLQSRYYDPEVGRFISIDDISYLNADSVNGLNLYAYCNNNPVMLADPSGNVPWYSWVLSGLSIVGGAILCFVPGAQAIGVGLIVGGGTSLAANIMSAAGVNGKTAGIITNVLSIVGGIALCFTPFASVGASMIGSGALGIAGGYISESLGGSFELGSAIGNIVGGIVGGKIYDSITFSQIAKQGILIGKMGRFETEASARGLAYYKGMRGSCKNSSKVNCKIGMG